MAGEQSEVPAGTEGNKPVSDPVDDNLLSATLGVDGVAHIDDSPSWQRALDVVVHSCVVLRQVLLGAASSQSCESLTADVCRALLRPVPYALG